MKTDWRISNFNGVLLAAYFVPTWLIVAFRIMVSPIHGLYDRPNIAVAIFLSDQYQLSSAATIKMAWMLALGKLTVAAFFTMFVALLVRPSIRRSGGGDEALGIALTIGSVISFASMVMAAQVGEIEALRLHATELMLLIGTAVLMLIEPPVPHVVPEPAPDAAPAVPNYPSAPQHS